MSNIISFQDAKKRRENNIKKTKIKQPVIFQNKSSNKKDVFIQEVMKYSFLRMSAPGSFVIVNTDELPDPFPPDPLPPMVA